MIRIRNKKTKVEDFVSAHDRVKDMRESIDKALDALIRGEYSECKHILEKEKIRQENT